MGDLMRHAQRDRPDGRAREPGIDVVEDGPAPVDIDGQREVGVRERKAVRPLLLAGPGEGHDVLRVGGELDDELVPALPAQDADDLARRLRPDPEVHAALLHVGTGDVQLQQIEFRVVEERNALDVVLDAVPSQVDDVRHIVPVDPVELVLEEAAHAGVLQPDAVHEPAGRLPDADTLVAAAWVQREPLGGDAAEP